MPLALTLNELLTNSVKHGAADRANRTVRVGLNENDDEFEFYVEDDGDGFDLESVRRGSSGIQLVAGLAHQLRGRFHVTRIPGARAVVRFPAGAIS